MIEHIRYFGSDAYGACIYDTSDFDNNKKYYIEAIELLIYDVLENTNVGVEELCMIGSYVEIAIENITYDNSDYETQIRCRDSW